jgi:hypothetical protein
MKKQDAGKYPKAVSVVKIESDSIAHIITDEDLELLLTYIDEVRFGSVTIHIRENTVVQIEKNEKIKLR